MGKSKKIKKYKAPHSKYVVVVDPWGTPGNPYFINNVSAWFELMIKDDHPGEEVKTIYTQGTHNNVVVELPSSIDVLPYLGAHHHERFLNHPYNNTKNVSYIYEYDYETQNDPTRRSWTANYSTSYDITIFPIKQPYPLPLPAPPPPFHVNYAKRPRNIPVIPPPEASPNELPPSNYINARDTPIPPPHTPKKEEEDAGLLVKKRDPYEEDDDAQRFLRVAGASSLTSTANEGNIQSHTLQVKEEAVAHHLSSPNIVKKEEPDIHRLPLIKSEEMSVDDFLDSVPIVKKEELVDYPPHFHSADTVEQGGTDENVYEPSAELLAAFAEFLPEHHVNTASRQSGSTHLVKKEVLDDSVAVDWRRERSTTMKSETEETAPSIVRVKPEPLDDYDLPPLRPFLLETRDQRILQRERSTTLPDAEPSTVRVKSEPQDDNAFPALHAVPIPRDPRLQNSGGSKNAHAKRLVEDEHRGGRTKRIKSEWETY